MIACRPFIMFQFLIGFKFSRERAAESGIEGFPVVNHFHIGRFRRHRQRSSHPAERRQRRCFPPDTGGKIETGKTPYLRFRNRLFRNRAGYSFGNPAVKGGAQPIQQHFRAGITHRFRCLAKSLTTGNRQLFIGDITAGGPPAFPKNVCFLQIIIVSYKKKYIFHIEILKKNIILTKNEELYAGIRTYSSGRDSCLCSSWLNNVTLQTSKE